MKLSDFDYNLPAELIAMFPLEKRDDCRLMTVDRKTGRIGHGSFKDIGSFFKSGDCMVFNDTKVMPARIFARRSSGARIEVLVLEKQADTRVKCLLRPAKRVREGEELYLDGGKRIVRITAKGSDFNLAQFEGISADEAMRDYGAMPLPPYIKRAANEQDDRQYQTVYAKTQGAVAAPTAGLHFSQNSLKDLKLKGLSLEFITLHVGWGTFRPIKTEKVSDHIMMTEGYDISGKTAEQINCAKANIKKLIAVGTTTVRALESAALKTQGRSLTAGKDQTDIFIYPGFEFKITDALITNFHLPKSTLFLLVCAFASKDLIMQAYQEAINKKYRFYSYGDAMVIV